MTMNSARESFEAYVQHKHRGTRIAVWVVMFSIAYLTLRILG
jgi:hypothetical protein